LIRFNPEGKRLFVLTGNQAVYVLDVSAFGGKKETVVSSQ
jgi:hypothetical protein